MSTAELATSYAALILADDGVEITVRPVLEEPSSAHPFAGKKMPEEFGNLIPGLG
jgi:hypothetical protein